MRSVTLSGDDAAALAGVGFLAKKWSATSFTEEVGTMLGNEEVQRLERQFAKVLEKAEKRVRDTDLYGAVKLLAELAKRGWLSMRMKSTDIFVDSLRVLLSLVLLLSMRGNVCSTRNGIRTCITPMNMSCCTFSTMDRGLMSWLGRRGRYIPGIKLRNCENKLQT